MTMANIYTMFLNGERLYFDADANEVEIEDINRSIFHTSLSELANADMQRVHPPYGDYIAGEGWRQRREQYFATHPRKCYMCGSEDNVQLHHLTYERLGWEDDYDLEPLCKRCHMALHAFCESPGVVGIIDAYRKALYDQTQEIKAACGNALAKSLAPFATSMLPAVIPGHKPYIVSIIAATLGISHTATDLSFGDKHGHALMKALRTKK